MSPNEVRLFVRSRRRILKRAVGVVHTARGVSRAPPSTRPRLGAVIPYGWHRFVGVTFSKYESRRRKFQHARTAQPSGSTRHTCSGDRRRGERLSCGHEDRNRGHRKFLCPRRGRRGVGSRHLQRASGLGWAPGQRGAPVGPISIRTGQGGTSGLARGLHGSSPGGRGYRDRRCPSDPEPTGGPGEFHAVGSGRCADRQGVDVPGVVGPGAGDRQPVPERGCMASSVRRADLARGVHRHQRGVDGRRGFRERRRLGGAGRVRCDHVQRCSAVPHFAPRGAGRDCSEGSSRPHPGDRRIRARRPRGGFTSGPAERSGAVG